MNLAQLYKKQSVTTASPKAIVIQLHDKMLKLNQSAKECFEQCDLKTMRERIEHTQNIVSYIMGSADRATEAGNNLYKVYRYYLMRLADAFVNPNNETFDELQGHFQSWRETWVQASSPAPDGGEA